MRIRGFLLLFVFSISFLSAQETLEMKYTTTKENPFGKYNPKAPKQLQDYKELIGLSKCESTSRNPDQTWAKPVNMTWEWKYIMNGMAVQDLTLKEDARHSGSIRQYDKDSLQWNVHYYSSAVTASPLQTWKGNRKENKIVLYKKQNAPNGTKGFSRLTFYDITNKSYKWIGEWVDEKETIVFPFWKIECKKQKS
ncbi:hypothetical protein [Polaribacter uvawellassae]|uniref:hypothetical protein n=1 Tax=Polaribacter uvawellassae TaxID=3133495 RepID=UPI00321B1C79